MLNERITRQQIIDNRLLMAGWQVNDPTQVVQEFDIIVNPQEKLDNLIDKVAPLMKYREAIVTLPATKYNLKDILVQKDYVEFGPQLEAISIAKYKELVEQKINELVLANPILKKIKMGEKINSSEAEELATALHNEHPHITIDLLRHVCNHRKAQLVQFVKHILGITSLETFPETVSKSFDNYVKQHSYLSSRQLQFLELLRKYILEKGELHKRNLIESPFTMLHPEGIRGVFSPREIEKIIEFTQKILAA
jgi:type I restriction enzyme, R subunit